MGVYPEEVSELETRASKKIEDGVGLTLNVADDGNNALSIGFSDRWG